MNIMQNRTQLIGFAEQLNAVKKSYLAAPSLKAC